MSSSKMGYPAQYNITKLTIDGNDIIGLFQNLSLYEDIYRPAVTGNIIISDTDGAGFIEKYNIEFIEPIEMVIENARGESLEFKGVLNGMRNEYMQGAYKFYTIDFTSEAVRKNEQTFVVDSYKNTSPEEIVKKMVEKLGGNLDTNAKGSKMQYNGSRKRPVDIIKYVLTHGVSEGKNKPEATLNQDSKTEKAKGTTGFLCWETVDGFKFETIDDILAGKVGANHNNYKTILANRNIPMEESMKGIVETLFTQIGDFQTKLRSGAFGSRNISFDMDTGEYKEYTYYNRENMTKKQKEALPEGKVTRFFNKLLDNQKFTNSCEKAQPNTGDQSRKYLNQNSGGQNTFSDQTGQMTLYPQFKFRAGDSIDVQISKVKDAESEGGYDEKHSGKYVIQAVGHHILQDGKAYTKIKTIRSTIHKTKAVRRNHDRTISSSQTGFLRQR